MRILCLLLILLPGLAHATISQLGLIFLWDDVSRGTAGYSRVSPDIESGSLLPLTPNLDIIAAAGYVHDNIKTSAVCSPTRARLLDYGPTGNPSNPLAHAERPADDLSHVRINPYAHNLVREAQEAGWKVVFTGKLHIAPYVFPTERKTFIKQLGFDDARFVSVGNPTNILPGVDYSDEALGESWNTCKGHNFHPVTDIHGNVEFTRTHTTKGVWDAASAMTAEAEASADSIKLLVLVWSPAAHSPNEPGDGATLACNDDTETNNDFPPNDSWTSGDVDDDVYKSNIEYNDTRMGEYIAEHFTSGAFGSDFIFVMGDNGIYGLVKEVLSHCAVSPGIKLTPYVCGTTTFFAAAGPGITAGKVTTSRLSSIDDVPSTILSLLGGNSIHPWGRNFADCMTESNSQTALSCKHTRDSVMWTEWEENGGAAGTISTPPQVATDPANTWTNYEVGSEVWLEGGSHSLLHRTYTVNESPMVASETFWQINDGVESEQYSTDVMWDSVTSGLIPEDGTGWDITATDAGKAALVKGHSDLLHQWDRDGAFTPTLGGGSF